MLRRTGSSFPSAEAGANSVARPAALITAGNLAAQAAFLAVTPILARHFVPGDFGALNLSMSAAAFLLPLMTLRYEVVIVTGDDADASAATRAALFISASVSALTVMCISLANAALGSPSWIAPAYVAVASSFLLSIVAVGTSWWTRDQRFPRIGLNRLLQGCVQAVASVAAALAAVTHGLLLGYVAGPAVAAIAAAATIAAKCRNSAVRAADVLRRHRATALTLTPLALTTAFGYLTLPMCVEVLFGTEAAGQFGLAWRIAVAPVALLTAAVAQVLLQRMSRLVGQPEEAVRLLTRTWLGLGAATVPIAILGAALAPTVFPLLFGARWDEAGILTAALMPFIVAVLIDSSTSTAYVAFRHERLLLSGHLMMVAARPLALWIGADIGSLAWGLIVMGCLDLTRALVVNGMLVGRIRRGTANAGMVHE